MAISVEKRGIFGRVVIVEDSFPLPASKKMKAEHDVVIYLDMASPTQIQWFLTAAPEYKEVVVHADGSKSEGYPRVKSWLDDIENKLDQVRYKPRQVQ
ncbi:MAG: hypothetical protein L7F78_11130 [Syntrophales bacterium LBB04]|nr:hypothetical protein [Syntrophales bacterium LBB04]